MTAPAPLLLPFSLTSSTLLMVPQSAHLAALTALEGATAEDELPDAGALHADNEIANDMPSMT
jgi:hypothetical protein